MPIQGELKMLIHRDESSSMDLTLYPIQGQKPRVEMDENDNMVHF